jgi:hypothetical protein
LVTAYPNTNCYTYQDTNPNSYTSPTNCYTYQDTNPNSNTNPTNCYRSPTYTNCYSSPTNCYSSPTNCYSSPTDTNCYSSPTDSYTYQDTNTHKYPYSDKHTGCSMVQSQRFVVALSKLNIN